MVRQANLFHIVYTKRSASISYVIQCSGCVCVCVVQSTGIHNVIMHFIFSLDLLCRCCKTDPLSLAFFQSGHLLDYHHVPWSRVKMRLQAQSSKLWSGDKGKADSHLSHRCFADLIRVLPDTLQEVFQVWHGDLLDLLAEFRQCLGHDLTETILAYSGNINVLQLLHGFQCGVVSGMENGNVSDGGTSTHDKLKFL